MEGAMDVLRTHLNKVRIPSGSNKVYKEECCVSFDTTKSEGGLYVDLNSFLGFGRDYVKWNYEKTGNPVYLHIKKTRRPDPEEEQPRKKPTIVAIGVAGGFSDKPEEYDESLSICILPDFIELPYPNVNLPEKVRSAVEQVLAAQGAERRDQLAAWAADAKVVSKYAEGLQQADNGVRIGATGWRCRFCDKTDNLWLNLSDGSILCGRKNWDGTGGNNHALEYYEQTKYPLVVKLGTIAADLTQADVYSYPEDDAVEDPLLAKHLQHFGIDFSALQKTESTTAELELDQNLNFDFTRLQEKGKQLEPLFGPGYTGLANLGNSCYLASVVQALLTTKDFQKRYFDDADLETAFKQAPSDPTLDFNFQMTKLAHGILSGAYSLPSTDPDATAGTEASQPGQEGIAPRMFKALVGQGHPEFSSARQQDAFEFYQHLLDLVEKSSRGAPQGDPARAFRFQVQERIVCGASGRVRRTARSDNVLSLQIPLEKAINADEVATYQQRKAAAEAAGEKLAADDVVRPRVPLSACLEAFAAPETIQDFYSSAIRGKTHAHKSAALGTFPPLLVLHMRKFVLDAGWVPRKLDVFVDVPDSLDLAALRAADPAPDEQELPDDDDAPGSAPAGPVPDPGIVSALEDMGFPRVRCEKAALNTQNAGPEEAMNWLLAHMDDPDIDSPVPAPGGRPAVLVDEAAVETLTAIGFSAAAARRALQETGGNVEAAAEWVFAHPDAGDAMDVQEAAGPATAGGAAAGSPLSKNDFLDGPPKYNLLAFVSHMGSSTHAGHYVAHIKKDGRWVIFNDSKVAASGDPPKDMGYLYFYQRED